MPDDVTAIVPSILRPLSTEEYDAPPRTASQQRALATAAASNVDAAQRLATPLARYVDSRRGTATGLLSMNEAAGARYFEVPPEAGMDDAAAAAAFESEGPVIDVQTHWIADRPVLKNFERNLLKLYKMMAPDWWSGLEGVTAYNI